MRYRLTLSYDGSDFFGWQVQPEARTVQGELEKALGILLRSKVGVTGAGRTDTGVNASYYVAHFDAPGEPLDCNWLKYKLNAFLPHSISIMALEPVHDDFHARFDAVKRSYTYYLHRVKDPFVDRFSWLYCYPDVDFDAMNRAARLLLGTHDFSCFEKSGGDNKTSICTVTHAAWTPRKGFGAPGYWQFDISADRFLRNMVRAVVGTLLEVGRGRRSEQEFASLILPPSEGPKVVNRSLAGESVPGHALFLSGVEYPGTFFASPLPAEQEKDKI